MIRHTVTDKQFFFLGFISFFLFFHGEDDDDDDAMSTEKYGLLFLYLFHWSAACICRSWKR